VRDAIASMTTIQIGTVATMIAAIPEGIFISTKQTIPFPSTSSKKPMIAIDRQVAALRPRSKSRFHNSRAADSIAPAIM